MSQNSGPTRTGGVHHGPSRPHPQREFLPPCLSPNSWPIMPPLAGCGKDSEIGGIAGPPEAGGSLRLPTPAGRRRQRPSPGGHRDVRRLDLSKVSWSSEAAALGCLQPGGQSAGCLLNAIGLAMRPSDSPIGIGNDSRVARINPHTAEATPISQAPFCFIASSSTSTSRWPSSPMDPGPHRRGVGRELVDRHPRRARRPGENSATGAGSSNEGRTPRLLGIRYPILPTARNARARCANLAYGAGRGPGCPRFLDPEGGLCIKPGRRHRDRAAC